MRRSIRITKVFATITGLVTILSVATGQFHLTGPAVLAFVSSGYLAVLLSSVDHRARQTLLDLCETIADDMVEMNVPWTFRHRLTNIEFELRNGCPLHVAVDQISKLADESGVSDNDVD